MRNVQNMDTSLLQLMGQASLCVLPCEPGSKDDQFRLQDRHHIANDARSFDNIAWVDPQRFAAFFRGPLEIVHIRYRLQRAARRGPNDSTSPKRASQRVENRFRLTFLTAVDGIVENFARTDIGDRGLTRDVSTFVPQIRVI